MASMMSFRTAVPAALKAGAAPRRVRAASVVAPRAESAGKEWMLKAPGITAPLGFFDPVGFCDAPTMTVSEAKRFRESEVTHGRVAMLAVLGWVVAEEFHPLFGASRRWQTAWRRAWCPQKA